MCIRDRYRWSECCYYAAHSCKSVCFISGLCISYLNSCDIAVIAFLGICPTVDSCTGATDDRSTFIVVSHNGSPSFIWCTGSSVLNGRSIDIAVMMLARNIALAYVPIVLESHIVSHFVWQSVIGYYTVSKANCKCGISEIVC